MNEDLFDHVDELTKNMYSGKVGKRTVSKRFISGECSSDSDDQNAALTGTKHILMERDTAK